MIANVVTVYVKPEHVPEFLTATRANRAGSRAEPGNLRFDILQAADDPCRFLFFEVFASQAALEAHRKTDHYLAWRAQAEGWMAKPREGRAHQVLDPLDPAEW
jgi:autoinducer 2-degrading protein